MNWKLSPGKRKGLEAVSTPQGVIAALAIDQRSAMRKLFSKVSRQEPEAVPVGQLAQYKQAVSRILTPHASAILLDPEFGLPAAAERSKNAGLILAYEKTGYDKSIPERLPSLLDSFSATRLREAGADGLKILLYYSPFSGMAINTIKHAWVERVGAECAALEIPFFLEIVSYHDNLDEKSQEFARIKPDIVVRSVEEFCKPRYLVDVLKIGVPVNMAFVESESGKLHRSETLYSRADAVAHFRRASDASSLPFIYLSEGVNNETFSFALELAAEAGSAFCGVLCGRATWQDGVPIFVRNGMAALEDWLSTDGVRNIENVNKRLAAARPWFSKFTTPLCKD